MGAAVFINALFVTVLSDLFKLVPQGLELAVENHKLTHEAYVGVNTSPLRPDEVNGLLVCHLVVEHQVSCSHCC